MWFLIGCNHNCVSTWCPFQKVINLLLHFHILVLDSLMAIIGFDVQGM
jgi:hypothetical protein